MSLEWAVAWNRRAMVGFDARHHILTGIIYNEYILSHCQCDCFHKCQSQCTSVDSQNVSHTGACLTADNHKHIAKALGYTVREYRYWDAAARKFDVEGMVEDLRVSYVSVSVMVCTVSEVQSAKSLDKIDLNNVVTD